MITNDLDGSGVASGTSKAAFRELKHKARAVKARPRKAATGGRGIAVPAGSGTPILPLASINLSQKEPSATPATPSTTAITREDAWRAAGDVMAQVIGRALNPRILEIQLPSGEHTRAIVNPAEHSKFGARKPVWVRRDPASPLYLVVGRYSQWGVRVQ